MKKTFLFIVFAICLNTLFAQQKKQTKPNIFVVIVASGSSGSILCPGIGLCKSNPDLCTDELLVGGMYIKRDDGCYAQVKKECTISKPDTPENKSYLKKLINLFKKAAPNCTIKQSNL